jgi:hypothetical protein
MGWRCGNEPVINHARLETRGHSQAVAYSKGRGELVPQSHQVPSFSFGDRKSEQQGFAALNALLDEFDPDLDDAV